jgi:hypothetical protein
LYVSHTFRGTVVEPGVVLEWFLSSGCTGIRLFDLQLVCVSVVMLRCYHMLLPHVQAETLSLSRRFADNVRGPVVLLTDRLGSHSRFAQYILQNIACLASTLR